MGQGAGEGTGAAQLATSHARPLADNGEEQKRRAQSADPRITPKVKAKSGTRSSKSCSPRSGRSPKSSPRQSLGTHRLFGIFEVQNCSKNVCSARGVEGDVDQVSDESDPELEVR